MSELPSESEERNRSWYGRMHHIDQLGVVMLCVALFGLGFLLFVLRQSEQVGVPESLVGKLHVQLPPYDEQRLRPVACLSGIERGFTGEVYLFDKATPIKEVWLDIATAGDNIVTVHFNDSARAPVVAHERECDYIKGLGETHRYWLPVKTGRDIEKREFHSLRGQSKFSCLNKTVEGTFTYNGCTVKDYVSPLPPGGQSTARAMPRGPDRSASLQRLDICVGSIRPSLPSAKRSRETKRRSFGPWARSGVVPGGSLSRSWCSQACARSSPIVYESMHFPIRPNSLESCLVAIRGDHCWRGVLRWSKCTTQRDSWTKRENGLSSCQEIVLRDAALPFGALVLHVSSAVA